jgi:hypothetical protein
MQAASLLDGFPFELFPPFENGLAAPEVDVSRRQVVQANPAINTPSLSLLYRGQFARAQSTKLTRLSPPATELSTSPLKLTSNDATPHART